MFVLFYIISLIYGLEMETVWSKNKTETSLKNNCYCSCISNKFYYKPINKTKTQTKYDYLYKSFFLFFF